jgi:PAS domain S-box-containing protein
MTIAQLAAPASYTFNLSAIPTMAAATAMLAVAALVLVRERRSHVSLLFLIMAATIALWQFAFSWMYCAADPAVALWWARTAYLGVPFIPTAVYHFTRAVARPGGRAPRHVWLCWAASAAFSAAIVATHALVVGVVRYWWGYYPRYGWLSVPYLLFFFGVMCVALYRCWMDYRRAAPGTHRQRMRALAIAFSIVFLGSFDYLAKFGVALYPFGYLPVFVFVALAARAIWRYRLADITTEMTVQPILNQMTEAVLVLDLEGRVRLGNRAAAWLFAASESRLRGEGLAEVLDRPLEGLQLTGVLSRQADRGYDEVVYLRQPGQLWTLSLSTSLIRDADQRPAGVMCFIHDITARRKAEATVVEVTGRDSAAMGSLADRAVASDAGAPAQADGSSWPSRGVSEGSDGPQAGDAASRVRAPLAASRTQRASLFSRPRSRWVAAMTLSLCIPIGVLLGVELMQVRRSLVQGAERESLATARLVAKAVETHFDGLRRYVESFAGRPALGRQVLSNDVEALRAHLEELVGDNPMFDRALIVDQRGVILADDPATLMVGTDLSMREWFQQASRQEGSYISALYQRLNAPRRHLVGVATPIESDGGRRLGYVLAQHTVEGLALWLMHSIPAGAVGVTLVDHRGTVLSRSRPDDSAPLDLSGDATIRAALGGDDGVTQGSDPVSGRACLVAYAPVAPMGWAVAMYHPMDAVLAPLRPIQRGVVGLTLACLSVMLIIGLVRLGAMRREGQALLELNEVKGRYLRELEQTLSERKRSEASLRTLNETLERRAQELVASQRALSRQTGILESILNSLGDGVTVVDRDGRFVLFNPAAERILGVGSAQVPPEQWVEHYGVFQPDLRTPYPTEQLPLVRAMRGEEVVEAELLVRNLQRPEGVWVSVNARPWRDAQGQVCGALAVFRDVTERKVAESTLRRINVELESKQHALMTALGELKQSNQELQEAQLQLIQAEKMESIGRLAAGVAHEVKNPLAITLMGVDFLVHHLEGVNGQVPVVLKDMEEAIRRADGVIRGLLDFSTAKQLSTTPESLNDVLDSALSLVKSMLARSQIQVVRALAADLPVVMLDRQKVEQVFLNVLMNAIHAMPTGGTLTVRTSSMRATVPGGWVGTRAADRFRIGDRLVIAEVDDTGPGIPADYLARVFDPFFTTKAPGQGTGLGLAVSRTIVELHHGAIEIGNRMEGGARARVIFKA